MRLHTLTVQAFGPFAGTETVDFDALSNGGLFLVHGPTGAGKTSVLDAVCFALYGRVPGVRDAAKSPRSLHAPPAREPVVTLEATLGGRRVRIERRPAWERPKKRGAGTTPQKAKVVVTELVEGQWRGRTTRPDEAGQFITDLVGLTLTQFCQVAMLPQGEFAKFLRADAKERRVALERIFGTEIFTRIEDWLAEHARSLRRAAEDAERTVLGAADRVSESGAAPRPADADDDLDVLIPWAAELATVTAATAADLAVTAEWTLAERDTARAALAAAQDLTSRQRRHAQARQREAVLHGRAAERAAIDDELAAADRVARVEPVLRAVEARRQQWEKADLTARDRLDLARELLSPDTPHTPDTPGSAGSDAAPTVAELRTAERRRTDEIARLEQLHGDAERLGELEALIAELDRQILDTGAELEAVAERRGGYPAHRAAVTERLDAARDRAAGVDAARAALESARARRDAREEADRLAVTLATATGERVAAVDAAQEARDTLLEVRQRRLEGMAAELAAQLADDAPCPVCGSMEHPWLAAPGVQAVTGADEEHTRAVADAAQERRLHAEQAVTALTEQLASAETASGGLGVSEAHEGVRVAEAEVASSAAAAEEVRRFDAELAELERAAEADQREETELTQRLAEYRERRAAADSERRHLRDRVDAARGEDPDLTARTARLAGEVDVLAGAAEAVQQRDTAGAELGTAEAEAGRALAEAGFPDMTAAWAAHREEEQRRELRERARDFDDELARVTALVADPELAVAAELDTPDLDGLRAAEATAEHAARQVTSAHDRVAGRAARLAELRVELDRRLAEARPIRAEHHTADALARLAAGTSGANAEHVALAAFVLAARLERVVAAANDRLTTMSGGRYELRHTVDRAAGDRSRSGGGLGLRVLDAWTGQERDPATLSGGETFITSLALALGLGDVASAEAGGSDIGTLFIDEGFGTLDEDTLEEVLTVLDGLRDGGRAVGVVSHVADLRARITARLTVTKTAAGSRLEVRV